MNRALILSRLKSTVPYFLTVVLLILADQATKELAKTHLRFSGTINIIGDFFILQYAENRGAFLSLGAGLSETARFLVFSVLVAFFLIYLIYLLIFKDQSKWSSWALAFVLAGGLGNLIDRVSRGRVIDFMNMGIGSLRTGIFNVADFVIVIGVIMLMITPKQKATDR